MAKVPGPFTTATLFVISSPALFQLKCRFFPASAPPVVEPPVVEEEGLSIESFGPMTKLIIVVDVLAILLAAVYCMGCCTKPAPEVEVVEEEKKEPTPEPAQLREARDRLRPVQGTNVIAAVAAQPAAEDVKTAEPDLSVIMRFMDGTDWEVEVQAKDCIDVVKSYVSSRLGVASARLKLILGTDVLHVSDKVGDCGITDRCVVNVMVLPPLYQGSQTYEHIANAWSASQIERPSEDEVHNALSEMIAKKAMLNEAFAARAQRARQPVQ